MRVLEEKLLKELPEDARLIVRRFLCPRWPHSCTAGSGLNQVWVYTAEDYTTSLITDLNQSSLSSNR